MSETIYCFPEKVILDENLSANDLRIYGLLLDGIFEEMDNYFISKRALISRARNFNIDEKTTTECINHLEERNHIFIEKTENLIEKTENLSVK